MLARLTRHAHEHGIRIVATADDHDLGHAEISHTPDWATTYPPHCMRGTPGQAKVVETTLRAPLTIPMHMFGPSTLARFLDLAREKFEISTAGSNSVEIGRPSLPQKPTILVLDGR